jgi:pimeloyl-ACP methyl ester carboxylesterase
MKIIDVGSGSPIVLIPGIQGRWEWMKPAVDALAVCARVITFSLADEPTSDATFDPANGFDNYVQQVMEAIDESGLERAVICGVSYGGLIAAAFAARHPDRVSGLILVSALPPTWQPNERARFYLRAPLLLSPIFIIGALQMYAEIAAAAPGAFRAPLIAARQGLTALRHMFSPRRMARRVRLLGGLSLVEELRDVRVPTLIVTGEEALDRAVPVRATREYARMWPHARQATIERTGHLGLVTRPREFAGIVTQFIKTMTDDPQHAAAARRASGW